MRLQACPLSMLREWILKIYRTDFSPDFRLNNRFDAMTTDHVSKAMFSEKIALPT